LQGQSLLELHTKLQTAEESLSSAITATRQQLDGEVAAQLAALAGQTQTLSEQVRARRAH
jgi:uncharacterized membrane protein (DUF4010 family)